MPPTDAGIAPSGAGMRSNAIIFDSTKDELYKITDNYKSLQRKLKSKKNQRYNLKYHF